MNAASSSGNGHFKAVTVNYRSREDVLRLADNLFTQCGCAELVVVNHDPSENLEGLSRKYPVRVVSQKNKGYGAGLNRGLREIREWDGMVLLCNPDVSVASLKTMSSALQYMRSNPDVACVLPVLTGRDGKVRKSFRQFYTMTTLVGSRLFKRDQAPAFMHRHFYMDRDSSRPMEVDWGCGAVMLVRGPIFAGTVSFDERFFLYFEDVDICAQIWRAGLKVVWHPHFQCSHGEGAESRRKIRFLKWHVVSALRFVMKYRGFPTRETLMRRRRMAASPAT